MADNSKDVVYIDIDDEITSVIEKVKASDGRIIALVLPKRATVFQSIVNMKLLKRSADEAKKRLVLITSEAGLLPLAGAVGLHVAKTLQSKPEVPAVPDAVDAEESVDEDASEAVDLDDAAEKPIGDLAGPSAVAAPLAADEAMETVELDNEAPDEATPPSTAPLPLAAKPKKDKRLKVPNFDRFRLWLVLGVLLLIGLGVFLYLATAVLPRATIDIKTNASNVNTSVNFTLDTTASTLNTATNVVPAKQVSEQKSYTKTVPATGQQNNGDKATGDVTMSAGSCTADVPADVSSGTGLSSNGLTFITQESASFVPVVSHGKCTYQAVDSNGSSNIAIKAQSGGTKYNLSSASFSVAGRSDVSASGSTSGGTDNIVKVVSQSDIDGATKQITTQDANVKSDLQNQLQNQGMYALTATFLAGTPATTASAKAGDAADNVTVTENINYTMFGAKQSYLKSLIDDNIKSQIDTSKQSILSEGLDHPDVKMTANTDKTAQVTMQTTGLVGPDLNTDTLKQQAAGLKSGEIQSAVKDNPGVTDVTVHLSPFWVTSAPKNTSKITVNIAKPTNTVNANNP